MILQNVSGVQILLHKNRQENAKFEKGLSHKNTKSRTFTFVSQFGAYYDIKFLTVYRDSVGLHVVLGPEGQNTENNLVLK